MSCCQGRGAEGSVEPSERTAFGFLCQGWNLWLHLGATGRAGTGALAGAQERKQAGLQGTKKIKLQSNYQVLGHSVSLPSCLPGKYSQKIGDGQPGKGGGNEKGAGEAHT